MKPLALAPLALLAACATTGSLPPTEVLRYHLPDGVPRGTIAVEPSRDGLSSGPFEDAVGRQLIAAGYITAAAGSASLYVATVDIRQRERDVGRRSPVSIGLGAGGSTGGYRSGVGLGGGISFPIGGRRGPLVQTELSVLIKRRADQATVWEGHANGTDDPGRRGATAQGFADRLASALFTGFPGESGRTISVP
ncbi:DUF4136 domain-containing protein [Sphingomonas bacterium]|uniref:DUF4136 domain-containing protein n=1 Tax=Sphingomonas bacterium TaxID=1895847 RepID=UPI001576EDD1|nr:hypothetical protein [Sphingomonas bacterium]